MPYITIRDLSEQLAIHDIEKAARREWELESRRRQKLEKWIVALLPPALLVMTAVFYMLSAPHTAGLLDFITPGFGWIAPIGMELGILIIAALRTAGQRNVMTLALLLTLIGMSMLINVIGGFMAVVELGQQADGVMTADIGGQTFVDLVQQFGFLPAAYQAALVLVLPVGISIPFITTLVGEILIKLAFGKVRLETEDLEQKWRKDASKVMHAALLQAAIKQGAGVKTATHWAQSVVDGLYGTSPVVPTAVPRQLVSTPVLAAAVESPAPDMVAVQKDQDDRPDNVVARLSRADVLDWLKTHDVSHLNDREACKQYMREKFGQESDAGYKTFNRARKALQEGNA